MSDRPGLTDRLLHWLKDRAPPLHTFLTKDAPLFAAARTVAGLGLFLLLAFALLWGGTGQSWGDAPVVVIETGSMMHCEQGVQISSSVCGATAFGRLGSIDPGDLVFVRDTDSKGDVATMAADGKSHHGKPGDVVVYHPGGSQTLTPIIHRAMFWIELHGDDTFSIEELGISRLALTQDNLNHQSIKDTDRFGLSGGCQLRMSHGAQSGWVTKGDNNSCWDQTGASQLSPPVQPDWLIGKARGEVPWIGLLKLFVFDMLSGTDNYENAPGDLKTFMWISVGAIIVLPYASDKGVEAYRRRKENDGQ